MTTNVDYVLPEVTEAEKDWSTIRDCVNGQRAVKQGGVKYLPYIMVSDKSPENVQRNIDYALRAVFYGVTKRTLKGMVGQVIAKPAILTVPEMLDVLHEDVDGGSVSIDQQAKQALSDTLSVGRLGLLTDYPVTSGQTVTRADLLNGRIRPTIQYYFAEQIINWRVETVNGLRTLTLVVLKEQYIKEDDGFKVEMDDQYRVLRLEGNVYTVTVYRKGGAGWDIAEGPITPTDSKGKPFSEILFTFVGSDNNDPGIDDAPLLDMATLNVAHYRNSADYEESCFIVGQPTPVLTGLTKGWIDDVWNNKESMPNGVALGSRAAIPLPVGGDAKLLQAEPNTLPMEAMKHKEEQMKALGAKLVEPKTGTRTLGEAQMDEASEASVLMTCAQNVSAAYTQCIKWAAQFVGAPVVEANEDEDEAGTGYELNTDFEISRMTADQRRQLLAEWQGGAISFTEYRSILRRAGIATQTDEQAQEEIDAATAKDMENQLTLTGGNTDGGNGNEGDE